MACLRFKRALDNVPCDKVLGFDDVVDISDRVGVSLFEAATVLDTLVARGQWRREFIDSCGTPISPERVAASIAGWLGPRRSYRVTWRRDGGGPAWLLA